MLEDDGVFSLARIDTDNGQNCVNDSNNHISVLRLGRKPHRRRIVKGRPETYAMTRRRKMLLAIIETENKDGMTNGIDPLLNKNNLLKYISCGQTTSTSHTLLDTIARNT